MNEAQDAPWTPFTDPEVAHVGPAEAQAHEQHGDEVCAYNWPRATPPALSGPCWTVALDRGLKVGELFALLRVYPTYSDASMLLTAHVRVSQLSEGTSGRIVRRVARLMH